MFTKLFEALEKNLAFRVFKQAKTIGDIVVYFGSWIGLSGGAGLVIAYLVDQPWYVKFLLGLLSIVLVLCVALVWKLYRSIQIADDETVPTTTTGTRTRNIATVVSVSVALILAVAISVKFPMGHQQRGEGKTQPKGPPPLLASSQPAPIAQTQIPTSSTQSTSNVGAARASASPSAPPPKQKPSPTIETGVQSPAPPPPLSFPKPEGTPHHLTFEGIQLVGTPTLTALDLGNRSKVTVNGGGIYGFGQAIKQGDDSSADLCNAQISAPNSPQPSPQPPCPIPPATDETHLKEVPASTQSKNRHIPTDTAQRDELKRYLSFFPGEAWILTTRGGGTEVHNEKLTYATEWASILQKSNWSVKEGDIDASPSLIGVAVIFRGMSVAAGQSENIPPTSPHGLVLNAMRQMRIRVGMQKDPTQPNGRVLIVVGAEQ